MSSLDKFNNSVLRHAVTLLSYNVGYDSAQTPTLDILADIMRREFLQLAKSARNHAEHFGRIEVNLDDVALALRDLNMNFTELEEYVQNFDPVSVAYANKIPEIPVKRDSKLNFLRPGSEEVLTRPMHVHEYMPPMVFQKESSPPREGMELSEGSEISQKTADSGIEVNWEFNDELVVDGKEESAEKRETKKEQNGEVEEEEVESSEDEIEAMERTGGNSKFVPFSQLMGKAKRAGENPALKRVRKMMEEDGYPIREIKSALMTTSGYLSSSREGRLPDTRPPPNREFFEASPPPPPPPEKKKRPLTMKRIVEGIKKIDKGDADVKGESSDKDEPELFGKPDQITTKLPPPKIKKIKKVKPPRAPEPKEIQEDKSDTPDGPRKKLKIDKDIITKMNQTIQEVKAKKQKQKMMKKLLQKNKNKKQTSLDESRKLELLAEAAAVFQAQEEEQRHHVFNSMQDEREDGEILDEESEESFNPIVRAPPLPAELQMKLNKAPKKKSKSFGLVDPDKLKKFKHKSLSISPHHGHPLLAPPKLGNAIPGSSRGLISPAIMESNKKQRGRPKKGGIISPEMIGAQGVFQGGRPIPANVLANLGRGLMEGQRPLKIKKSHMEQINQEPDMRSLIPEVQLNVNVPPHPPPMQRHPQKAHKPPRMQNAPPPPSYNELLGIASQHQHQLLPPPPPLIKMPAASPNLPPAIQITPATPSTPGGMTKEPKQRSSVPVSVCSSVTITPIDFGGGAVSTAEVKSSKKVPPSISSPPALKPKPKDKSPVPVPMQEAGSTSGLTITPIMIDRYGGGGDQQHYEEDQGEEEEYDDEYEQLRKNYPQSSSQSMSMLAKLEQDMKSKEERRKEKERKKELKKEKKKEKKDKDRKGKKDKDKKKKKEVSEDGSVGAPSLSVPKLTLKISGLSGTPTPTGSPLPPQNTQQLYYEEQNMQRQQSPPDVARFSPLVTRPPTTATSKPARAAKAQAAAAMSAEAMGSSAFDQYAQYPTSSASASTKKAAKGVPKSKEPKSKSKGLLVTETVGCIVDEHGNKIWICPWCGRQDDGSPMIGCDRCDDWYHFVCVGITKDPDPDTEWFCPRCKKKKKDKMK